jgi:hypothetical protein
MKLTKEKLLQAHKEDVYRLAWFMGWSQDEFNFTYEELIDWIVWHANIKYKD